MSNLLNPYNKGTFYIQQEDFETGDESSDSAPTGWNYTRVNDVGDGAGSSIRKSSDWFTTGSYSHRLKNGYSTSSQWNGYITTMTLYKDYDLTGVYKISVDTNQFIDLNGGMEAYIEILINSNSVYKVETDINTIETLSFDVSNYTGNNTITFKTYIHNISSGTASKYCTLYVDNLKFENYGNIIKGYWNFEEGSGTIAYDSSVNNINLTLSGTTYKKESDGKYSIYLDGSGYLETTDNWNTAGSHSTVFWVKITSNSGYIYDYRQGSTTVAETAVIYNTDYSIYINFYGKGNLFSGVTINDDKWHMVVVTVDQINNKQNIYIDGNLKGSSSFAFNLGNSFITRFGSRITDSDFVTGNIRLPIIFNKVLTPEEVKKLYQDTYIGDNND